MSVRPFYISADIEGRKTELTGGPRRKDGYMNIEITQREERTNQAWNSDGKSL